ncbi:MAG TPA: DUF1549 domain-containing protein, partial [Thermoanaerobaculia bacterium]|nr:DUF1549 domain-containing protein [Thermoanaerobaculia bacterium]
MRGRLRTAVVLLSPLLLFASEANRSCPLGPSHSFDSAAMYRSVSATAEMVAPSGTGGGRLRAVGVAPAGSAFPREVNFIDRHLFGAMRSAGIVPAPIAGDEEFLRRVTLDLTGTIPDAQSVVDFVKDSSPDKRSRKIDELLASEAFVDRWTMWFGDLVQNVSASSNVRLYSLGRNAYYNWIRDSIRARKPYDAMVRELLAGKGDNFTSGPANYVVRQLQNNGPPQDTFDNLAAHSGEKFLGMPLLCLSCHDGAGHLELVNRGLQTKKRSDFWGMAAFFSRTTSRASRYTDPNNPNAFILRFDVADNTNGAYRLNTTSGNKTPRQPVAGGPDSVEPAYMFTGEKPRPGESYRDAYGRMLTGDRQFARAAVNYLWKEMFAIGIVEPVGGFDLARLDPAALPPGQTLQPVNPQLLEELTSEFIALKYDLRGMLRTIAMSSAYQLSSKYPAGVWNE